LLEKRVSAKARATSIFDPVIEKRLFNLRADLHRRIERGHWILEDHPDLFSSDLLKLFFRKREEIFALKVGFSFNARGAREAKERLDAGAFSRAALSDDADRFSLINGKRDVSYRVELREKDI
jgi:hypothetical protein